MNEQEIEKRFQSHSMGTNKWQAAQNLRRQFKELALSVNEKLPEGREKSIVLTKLEEASMMATAGIARMEEEKDKRKI